MTPIGRVLQSSEDEPLKGYVVIAVFEGPDGDDIVRQYWHKLNAKAREHVMFMAMFGDDWSFNDDGDAPPSSPYDDA